eukprot:Blabericola_migrator_1__11586@NODE_694_length_6838_cov_108_846108_g504_i0_p3_GENE_NODE_694_length_6838_cov_108_846108_g504_i0NODE_694_length_6838_cov_108_846108_g504_i0_p3_ORF_typecomplete_len244_score33_60_NODE_694_length_6838_cov_108_846108_g504_i0170901
MGGGILMYIWMPLLLMSQTAALKVLSALVEHTCPVLCQLVIKDTVDPYMVINCADALDEVKHAECELTIKWTDTATLAAEKCDTLPQSWKITLKAKDWGVGDFVNYQFPEQTTDMCLASVVHDGASRCQPNGLSETEFITPLNVTESVFALVFDRASSAGCSTLVDAGLYVTSYWELRFPSPTASPSHGDTNETNDLTNAVTKVVTASATEAPDEIPSANVSMATSLIGTGCAVVGMFVLTHM